MNRYAPVNATADQPGACAGRRSIEPTVPIAAGWVRARRSRPKSRTAAQSSNLSRVLRLLRIRYRQALDCEVGHDQTAGDALPPRSRGRPRCFTG
jgi:hypothetical protein